MVSDLSTEDQRLGCEFDLNAIETHPLPRGGTDLILFRGRTNESEAFAFDGAATPEQLQFDLDPDRDSKEVHGCGAKR